METATPDEGIARRARMLRIHLLIFASVSIILCAIDVLLFDTRWFYWPVMVWGALFGAHFLYCKSLAVDDDWAEARAGKIRDKSYDLGHIRDIEVSFKKSQSAEETPPENKD
jgi:uncharacterized membrane protein YdbT with pleckstrin-like domain